jgi:predicted DsbA family dithiol-disulfide isomerase
VRLAKIKKEFGEAVEFNWRSFLLRPYPEPKPLEKFKRYTQSWKRPAEQKDAARFRVWSTDNDPPSHSVPPSIAVKAAARIGEFDVYHLALMDAYFYQNRNVTDFTTILAVAREQGLDMERFEAAVNDADVHSEVVQDHNDAIKTGVTGVPAVVVDGKFPIPGAQDLDFYRHLVKKLIAADQQQDAGG